MSSRSSDGEWTRATKVSACRQRPYRSQARGMCGPLRVNGSQAKHQFSTISSPPMVSSFSSLRPVDCSINQSKATSLHSRSSTAHGWNSPANTVVACSSSTGSTRRGTRISSGPPQDPSGVMRVSSAPLVPAQPQPPLSPSIPLGVSRDQPGTNKRTLRPSEGRCRKSG